MGGKVVIELGTRLQLVGCKNGSFSALRMKSHCPAWWKYNKSYLCSLDALLLN